jgi:two-component system cell cycle sensor histidine kinase/response regulator CckA
MSTWRYKVAKRWRWSVNPGLGKPHWPCAWWAWSDPTLGKSGSREEISWRRERVERPGSAILLVEDQEAVRESAAEYLTENGYTVLRASRGLEALEIAQQHEDPIHLLLTDVVMPQMSGRELSERITNIHPETKVIFMSGYSNNLLSNQQVLDPKHELLQKPFRLEALGQRIRETLTNRRAASAGK